MCVCCLRRVWLVTHAEKQGERTKMSTILVDIVPCRKLKNKEATMKETERRLFSSSSSSLRTLLSSVTFFLASAAATTTAVAMACCPSVCCHRSSHIGSMHKHYYSLQQHTANVAYLFYFHLRCWHNW